MREIKFRAWVEEFNMMFYQTGINPFGSYQGEHGHKKCGGQKPQGCAKYLYLTQKIMQYTGLEDCRGKEIYEGDIVTSPKCKHPYQIIFLMGSFDVNYPACCPHCKNGNASHGSLYEMLAFDDHVEVIGNIYENPELLK